MEQTQAMSDREAKLVGIVRELLRELGAGELAQRAGLDSSLDRDLGVGSLERMELLLRVERAFSRRLPDEAAQRAETLRGWALALTDAEQAAASRIRYDIRQPGDAPPAPAEAKDFRAVLRLHAESRPERVQVHLFDQDRGREISYGELYRRASETAAGLVASGLQPGETVALMLPTSADFFYGFLGVMLAGGIAAPIYPPARPKQIEDYVRRQSGILRNAEARYLISFDRAKIVADVLELGLPALRETVTVDDLRARGAGARSPDRQPEEIFFLQYTSGSTGDPKGVTLSHANVLANIQGIGWGVDVRPDDAAVSWLPLYHDMGLIGSWLFSLYYALPLTVLSPLDFLARPERWLWAMSDSRASLCPAPNFSYELCARKIRDEALEGVDLSRWRVAISGGEPILPETLQAFADRFAPWGFRRESYMPCYGLAESSVALTFPPRDRAPVIDVIDRLVFERDGRAEPADLANGRTLRFVANGAPLPGHEVKIVDPAGAELPDRARGRILFRGPSRTAGYFRNPKATAAVIDAEGWMDSGDLGYLSEGELYVAGRLKDVIIKSGHNIVPQDVEIAAANVEGVRRGCVAAFGSRDERTGTEALVVVAETRSRDLGERESIRQGIVAAVNERVGLPPDDVRLVAPQTVPKTSSGKIRRAETRLLYESGRLDGPSRSPWLQLARLWLTPPQGWRRRLRQSGGERVRGAARSMKHSAVAALVGLPARALPDERAAFWWSRAALRRLLNGDVSGADMPAPGPRLLLVARATAADPARLIATAARPVLLAEERPVEEADPPYSFLLAPLTLSQDSANLRDRLRTALARGFDVSVFADSPPGSPGERCRFRLEAFQAAADAGAQLVPVWISSDGEVRYGDAIAAAGGSNQEWFALRERLRRALTELAGEAPAASSVEVAAAP